MPTIQIPAAPVMERRPDGRLEVRHEGIVLMQSLDRWPVVRIEAYVTDPEDGIEMFQGYLNEPNTPRRLEFLALWAAAGVRLMEWERDRAKAPLSPRVRRALQYALWDLQIMGRVLRSPRFDWRRPAGATRCA